MRHAPTYRNARRNAALRPLVGKPTVWAGAKLTVSVYGSPLVCLNRSLHWASAKTYAEARVLSPSTRLVR